MPSQVSICNMALGYLNHAIRIAAIDENSNEADQCSLYYEPALRATLRAFPWNFAMRYATLANLGTPISPSWTVMYAVPSDAVALRPIMPEIPGTPANKYEVAFNGTAKVIMCNVDDATARYTAFVDDPNIYDAQFVTAFAWQLASEMALVLTGSVQMKQMAETQFRNVINSAWVSDGSEGIPDEPIEAEWIRARYDGGREDLA